MFTLSLALAGRPTLAGECPLAHTHIGRNPTWRPDWDDPGNPDLATDPDPTDDNQLWFFSLPPIHPIAPTPGWPEWGDPDEAPFLHLVLETDPTGNPIPKPGDPSRFLWTCRFFYSEENGHGDPDGVLHLDGWHSAHGPQGEWDLETVDEQTVPDWDIWLERLGTSVAEDDFFMMLPNGTPVLDVDGSTYHLEKEWLADKDAWGFHEHMGFYFWLTEDLGQEVSATFSAFDTGGLYDPADPFVFRFQTVPEPGAAVFLAAGLLALRGIRR